MARRRRPTTLALLAAIEASGLEDEFVAARRAHPMRSARWAAAKVIAEAARNAAPGHVIDLTGRESPTDAASRSDSRRP